MTLKYPLVNLISRGHLPLSNQTAALNFAKNIEDEVATRICYEMMKCDDPVDAARFLEEAVKAHREITEGVPAYFAESTSFANARDMILMREGSGDVRTDTADGLNPYHQFMTLVKTGGTAAGIMYLLKLTKPEQETILQNLRTYNKNLYTAIADSFAGRALKLPNDEGEYFKRMFNSAVGSKTRQGLSQTERESLKNFRDAVGKNVGIGVAIAAGITTAIIAISMIYKKYFSAEAKACSGVSGKARSICMTKARIKACDVAIGASKKALLECNSAKNEEDCIFKMKVEIRHWTKKKMIEEEKLKKLLNVNSASFDTDKKNDPFS